MIDIADAIQKAQVVPVLRLASSREAIIEARRLLDGGLTLVEIAATTPDWLAALTEVRATHPHAVLGIGTVTDPTNARRAIDAGADFLVSPYCVPAVRAEAGEILIEGGLTPGEIASAAAHGLAKLFPAHVVGPSYLRSLLAVLPGAKIMPTGGIELNEVSAWLGAGAHAVGIGSGLSHIKNPAEALRALTN
jgi:2-dehydro-3-deoxyphosphogluconate aldolase / (4S)-4-hydroxy-2-oxoglutarate aldolase